MNCSRQVKELAAYAAQLPIAAPQDSIDKKGPKDKLRHIWNGSPGDG